MRRFAIVLPLLFVACAASDKKSAEAPAQTMTPAPEAAGAPARTTPTADAEKAPAPTEATPSAPPKSAPATSGTSARAVAMSQASNEVDTAQRELDVAGGDCRNACRALGSMDRAAGRLCGLASSNDEQQRCGDAKKRVYSARDKIRNTCGSCPDVSVERSAPIPSQ